jgi:hypothetical protein
MADLYSVYFGRSKKKINNLLMTDTRKKCENYVKARESNVEGFHEIRLAEEGSKTVPKKNKWKSGYISKGTFNPHT